MPRRAVIDIGTNSIKLLVADVTGQDVRPVWEESKQTRLGRGFYETHQLQPEAIAKTAKAVAKFAEAARKFDAESVRIIATSAARDAVNPGDLTTAIAEASGLRIEIIPGEQEAEWAFRGVTSDPELARRPVLILDVGGGSSEFILGQGEQKHFCRSYPLGTVRLLEKIPHSDPPVPDELARCCEWLRTFLNERVRPELEPALRREAELNGARRGIGPVDHETVQLVGTGGTASILARMEAQLESFDRARIETTRLNLERVRRHMQRMWSLPLAERKQIIGLPRKRADVMLTGVAIYEAVMEQFDFSELRVSTRGLRFAALMDRA